jgi:hypothetical protein
MKQPPPFQHAPLKFTAKKCAAEKFLKRIIWLSASCVHEDQAEGMTAADKPRMNPTHRDAGHSVGLHLFQELSTLGQQVAHTLLLCQGLRGIEPMFPARTPRPRQPFGGARSGTSATVHTASSIGHRRRSTCSASAGLSSAPGGRVRVSYRIAVFQPAGSMCGGSIIRPSFLHCLLKPFQDPDGLRLPQ